MRNLRNIGCKASEEILAKYPSIKSAISGDLQPVIHISVFDHWLSEDEALYEISKIENHSYNVRLHEFCYGLFSSYSTYFVKLKGIKKQRISLKVPTTNAALCKLCTPSHPLLGERCRFLAVIPELGITYAEGSDYTHHIYRNSEVNLEAIESMAKLHRVNILK